MRITNSMGDYRHHRKLAIAYALERVSRMIVFTWNDFQKCVKDYEFYNKIRICTPERIIIDGAGDSRTEGGWDFLIYQRINRVLNTLADAGKLHYVVVKGKRYYRVLKEVK